MFMKLHLFSQDSPDGSEEFEFRASSYFRMVGNLPKGPARFKWSERQLSDLEELWHEPDAEGARDRLARDLGSFAEKLGWTLDLDELEDAEERGEEVLLTLNSSARELYFLPWEVIRVGASDSYLADYSTALVRYAVPGCEARKSLGAPSNPGVLFAWSDAGGAVPHDEQAESIRGACEASGAVFKEIANVGEAELQAALDDDPPSVLHLLCHGVPGPEGEPPRLLWGKGGGKQATATRLARMLRRHKKAIRLVVLSACGSGDGQQDVLFMSSLAQELHKKGIPNVVASRYPLSVRGSRVLVKALYDKLLREAWSLERSLESTRQTLLKADADGNSYSGDAYGMQLYAHDTERFVSANGVEAERPVLASYPFGTAEQPTPQSLPPRKDSQLEAEATEQDIEDAGPELIDTLQQAAEDTSLKLQVEEGSKGVVLTIDTTVDGAQRVLSAWRSGELSRDTGLKIFNMKVSKLIKPPLVMSTLAFVGVGAKVSAASAGATAAATGSKIAGLKFLAAAVASAAAISTGVAITSSDGEPAGKGRTQITAIEPAGNRSGSARSIRAITADAAPEIVDASIDAGFDAGTATDFNAGGDAGVDVGAAAGVDAGAAAGVDADVAAAAVSAGAAPVAGDAAAAAASPSLSPGNKPAIKPAETTGKPPAGTTTSKPPASGTASGTGGKTAPTDKPKSGGAIGAVLVNQQAQYDPIGGRVRIRWTIPSGAVGVLVVKSNTGPVRGKPTAGKTYSAGSAWSPSAGAVVSVSGNHTSKVWGLAAEQTMWLALWAFDAEHNYSAMEPFKFTAPPAQ